MLYFIYGPDGYRVKQSADSIKRQLTLTSPQPVRAVSLDWSDRAAGPALEHIFKNTSLFPETRCVTVSGAFAQKGPAQELAGRIGSGDIRSLADVTLIVSETGEEAELARKSRELFEHLTGPGVRVTRVPFLTGIQLENWVQNELKSRGTPAEAAAVRELIRRTGNESWALVQETEKLANYSGGKPVSVGDVQALVPERNETDIFEFTDALAAKDKPRAMALLYRELASGRDPYSVLAAVIYQFRNLLSAKDLLLRSPSPAGLAQKIGVPPFVARKLAIAAGRFELRDLISDYQSLSLLDAGIKHGSANLEDGLYMFVLGS